MASGSTATSGAFELGRRTGVCAVSGRELEPGDEIVSFLVEPEGDERVARVDVLRTEWDGTPVPGAMARWQCVVPERAPSRGPVIDAASLTDLFEQLTTNDEDESPERAGLRYVLALLLVRRRVLEVVGAAGRGVLLVRPRSEPESEPVPVHEPELDTDLLGSIQTTLTDVLGLEEA
ncbi:MAG: hypothetical protein AAGI30_05610 [Planctomycetota bacterium]